MKDLVFFSIIIPTYNSGRTLSIAIESILRQDFTNYEVLIIDACSTDNTLQIANDFNDSRIKILSEPDKGIYDAMNKGIKLAKGQWLYFLGSDDVLFDNEVLQKVEAFILLNKVDVVYGDVHSSRFGGLYDGEFDDEKINNKNICHQSIFFTKFVFKKTGLFDLYFSILADWDHNLKWFLNSVIKQKYINLTIAEYADGGVSSTRSDRSFFFLKQWKYALAGKHKLSLPQKFNFFFKQCRKLYRLGRKRDLVKIVFEFPKLFV